MSAVLSRRAALSGAAASVAISGAAAVAMPVVAAASALEADWQAIRSAYAALAPLADQAAEDAQWAIIDAASYRILDAGGTSPRDASIQLLVGMLNSIVPKCDMGELERLILAEDVPGLMAVDKADRLDWSARFYVRSLVILAKMEGRTNG